MQKFEKGYRIQTKSNTKRKEDRPMLFVHYPKCTTCKRAKKWLDEHQISYEERDIKENNPSLEELKEWYQRSGLPLKRFFNTSGMLYKEMKLKDKLPEMSEDEQLALLASDGMLVKRPIVVTKESVLVGFKEAQWEEEL
ncbi:transcriptional regulator, Spx/MgsR family [Mediterraneibacter gnavus ATCC 29149]|uniref:Transcriptional regulator, Spx/MgsR family n=2 Tax=Mediterraneibacter gnavus TaxID=33038 RepID=A7B123_MEDG7|nr:transcriptional regulator, Spx/MgsR family [Mediterraneibacter gnavus ATCC 29149]